MKFAPFLRIAGWWLALVAWPPAQADEFSIPPEPLAALARDLQQALAAQDKRRVAQLVHFPLRVNGPGRQFHRLGRQHLLQDFDRIFTPEVRAQVMAQDPTDLFQNYQGAMFGNGAVWVDRFCVRPATSECPVRVKTVNLGP